MKKQSISFKKKENHLAVIQKPRPSHEDIQLINPNKEALKPSILRTFEGFTDIAEEEAQSICVTSLCFAQILLETISRQNVISIDNQHVVCLDKENGTPIIEMNRFSSTPLKNNAA